jgi:threonine/homoserine/homoserine lactone efflux protein
MMLEALASVLGAAVGVVLSPVAVVAVVLLLATPNGVRNGWTLVAGWLTGFAVIGVIGIGIGDAADSSSGDVADWRAWMQVVLGVVLLVLAVRQWKGRPTGDGDPSRPRWMEAIDELTPVKALGVGFALVALNPKNAVLGLSAASTVATAGLTLTGDVVVYSAFGLLTTVGLVGPLLATMVAGERAAPGLARLRTFLLRHSAVITGVVLVVVGIDLVGDGIAGLA